MVMATALHVVQHTPSSPAAAFPVSCSLWKSSPVAAPELEAVSLSFDVSRRGCAARGHLRRDTCAGSCVRAHADVGVDIRWARYKRKASSHCSTAEKRACGMERRRLVGPEESTQEGTASLAVKGGWWKKAGLPQAARPRRTPPFSSCQHSTVRARAAYGVVGKEQRPSKHRSCMCKKGSKSTAASQATEGGVKLYVVSAFTVVRTAVLC